MRRWIAGLATALFFLALAGWAGRALYEKATPKEAVSIPTTTVKRGDVRFEVSARGDLQGGNSEMLVAPMTGGREMVITDMRTSGDLVEPGDIVAQFDTTEQDFALKEAEADLAEAEQQYIQAVAESEAREEESRYALVHAAAEVRLAELEARKNPLIAAITARQNVLAMDAARDRLAQLKQDEKNRAATSRAGIAIQEAARNKVKVRADIARRNIEAMTLKAKTKGYVAIQSNTITNVMFTGMSLPLIQLGDTIRAGMAVAQIPDLKSWEASTRIGELDRGHLAEGQPAEIEVIALPGHKFTGKVKNLGGTSGPPWNRTFECKVSLDNPRPELRPGMSVDIVITTGRLTNVLWAPSQALFESDGRAFVYLRTPSGFQPHDVKLVQRSESRVVLQGLAEGQRVALASPTEQTRSDPASSGPNRSDQLRKKGATSGVMKAVPKT